MESAEREAEGVQVLRALTKAEFMGNLITALLALNDAGEKTSLDGALNLLGRLFRYADAEGDRVPLAEELRFLEQYLELQRYRFPDRLSYRIEAVPPRTERRTVRRFCLFDPVETVLGRVVEEWPGSFLLVVECGAEDPSFRVEGIPPEPPRGGPVPPPGKARAS